MLETKHKIYDIYIFLGILITSVSTTTMILFDHSKPDYYTWLWILPFIYMLYIPLIWLQFPGYKYKISTFLILSFYGARMVFVPLVMNLGDYATYGLPYIFDNYMGKSLILMCWEFSIIIIFILTRAWKKNSDYELPTIKQLEFTYYENKLPTKLKFYIIMILLYIVLIIIGTPGLLKESFFFTTGRSEESYALTFTGGVNHNAFGLSFGSQLVTIAFTLVWVLQALLPAFILAIAAQKVKKQWFRTLIFLITLLVTLLVSTEGRAHSIECALALLITARTSMANKFKINYNFLIIMILGVTLIGLLDKSDVSNSLKDFSIMISAYISGPQNVATAIFSANKNESINFLTIFSDFLQRIPYLTKIFTNIFGGTSNITFNEYFGNQYLGQIIPSIGLGYGYFGFLFAPIVPLIGAYLAMYFEKCAYESPDVLRKNLYYLGVIMMARATVMSNMLSGVTYLGNFLIAWIILKIGFTTIKYNEYKLTDGK